MKILALEYELPTADPDLLEAYQAAQARRVLELTRSGILREIYTRVESRQVVMILECPSLKEAHEVLHDLPMAQAGLIALELIPLAPYDGFSRLLEE